MAVLLKTCTVSSEFVPSLLAACQQAIVTTEVPEEMPRVHLGCFRLGTTHV